VTVSFLRSWLVSQSVSQSGRQSVSYN